MEENLLKITILLVEDNEADARLITEYLKDINTNNVLHLAKDGIEAINFLNKHCKHNDHCLNLVILDLNLPKMNGLEVLKKIKKDLDLKCIPVIILTTSEAEEDINESYNAFASCYITKPVDFNEFVNVISVINEFWFKIVQLPP